MRYCVILLSYSMELFKFNITIYSFNDSDSSILSVQCKCRNYSEHIHIKNAFHMIMGKVKPACYIRMNNIRR